MKSRFDPCIKEWCVKGQTYSLSLGNKYQSNYYDCICRISNSIEAITEK